MIEATGLRESQTPQRRGMIPLSEWENSQYGSRRGPISPNLANQMIRELEALIARVESALVSAETVSEIANADKVATRELGATAGVVAVNASQDNSRQAIADARAKLETFRQLVAAQNYDQAHQQWRQAHRLLWEHYPTDRQLLVQPEIRAIWLDRGTIVQAKSAADLAKLFDRLRPRALIRCFLRR
ncbi:MAG: hypothetical protein HC890_07745 [Chloroflexaceae bacterium]|nr:hypothetical protein [Chloroflexaceae bacterium]